MRLKADSRQPTTDSWQPATDSWKLETGSRELSAALAVARDFSPRVMAASDREALLDVAGLGRLFGTSEEIARQLAQAVFDAGVKASVAIGPTQTIARLLAHAGASRLAPRTSELPVHMLEELEAPAAMNERDRLRPYETLQRWGIATLGELAALPAADLSSRLGRRGVALQRLARGLDPRPFVPDAETPRFADRLELEWPIDALEPLSFVFARMLDSLSARLERADRGAIAVRLDLRLTDRSTCTRVLPLPAPMRDARVLRTLLLLHLESSPPPAGIDVVAIELDPAPARIVWYSLLERPLPSPETLSTLTARLSALVGESRVGSAVLLDSHAPDAFEIARFAPETSGQGAVEGVEGAGVDRADRARDAVLRRQRTSVALRVSARHGRPVHIAASRRGVPSGAIAESAGPWRTSGAWWMASGARGEDGRSAWDNDEWDVALKSGAICRIYRDRTTDRWFLEGIYD
jgi:protein ImuB